jgi:hypothetical protein
LGVDHAERQAALADREHRRGQPDLEPTAADLVGHALERAPARRGEVTRLRILRRAHLLAQPARLGHGRRGIVARGIAAAAGRERRQQDHKPLPHGRSG